MRQIRWRYTKIVAAALVLVLAVVVRSRSLQPALDGEVSKPIEIRLGAEFTPLLRSADQIRGLHEVKRPSLPGDWLERFEEPGQSFPQYVQFQSFTPLRNSYDAIDVLPIGEFDETQQRIIDQTAEFMRSFFNVPVRVLDAEPFPEAPESSRRIRGETEQVLSTWIISNVVLPRRQPDAMATIGLVTCDLWPGELNWVFGQASMSERIGVWSLYRNGDPRQDDEARRLCLRRTIKTAIHETGHMLGIPHCAAYECCMNGSRSREESDRQPLEFCPDCQAKIWWACQADPADRCQALFAFCDREGLREEAAQFEKEWKALQKSNPPETNSRNRQD